jgi:hypothetical protein
MRASVIVGQDNVKHWQNEHSSQDRIEHMVFNIYIFLCTRLHVPSAYGAIASRTHPVALRRSVVRVLNSS